jgi:hypothetical protein
VSSFCWSCGLLCRCIFGDVTSVCDVDIYVANDDDDELALIDNVDVVDIVTNRGCESF